MIQTAADGVLRRRMEEKEVNLEGQLRMQYRLAIKCNEKKIYPRYFTQEFSCVVWLALWSVSVLPGE